MSMSTSHSIKLVLSGLLTLGLVGCGDEEQTNSGQRGLVGDKRPKKKNSSRRSAGGDEEEEVIDEGPPRPPVALDSKSFQRRRDPFMSFLSTEEVLAEPPVTATRAERRVKMASYAFEDLKLIAIVNSGRGVLPRALFLASDGKSKTIKQGEYFSSAEVLLAAVNRDYVEIEVVDDDLGSSLNLLRGERRAIYLRTD